MSASTPPPGSREIPSQPGYAATPEGKIWSSKSGRLLKDYSIPSSGENYRRVSVSQAGVSRHNIGVHRLVCEAFHGPAPEGKPLALHDNGVGDNNRPENLRWGSHSENMLDSVRHGTHHMSRRTHCPQGHEYSGENLFMSDGARRCRECSRERQLVKYKSGLPSGDSRHGTNTGYVYHGCRCGDCRKGRGAYLESLKS